MPHASSYLVSGWDWSLVIRHDINHKLFTKETRNPKNYFQGVILQDDHIEQMNNKNKTYKLSYNKLQVMVCMMIWWWSCVNSNDTNLSWCLRRLCHKKECAFFSGLNVFWALPTNVSLNWYHLRETFYTIQYLLVIY